MKFDEIDRASVQFKSLQTGKISISSERKLSLAPYLKLR